MVQELNRVMSSVWSEIPNADSEIVMVDGTFFGNSFEQDQSWDDSGTTISGI